MSQRNIGSDRKKVVLITGSSRGIGAATALEAAREGYSVCINYIKDDSSAEEISHKIKEINGECLIFRADVSKENEVLELFNSVESKLGSIDALVNNVGVLRTKSKLADMTAHRMSYVINTNIMSTLLCCREAVKRMSKSNGGKGGAIVNISSAASRLGSAGEYVDYAASKGAVDSLTIGLSKEVANEGIRVNCVRPGFIYTDIHSDGGEPGRVKRLEGVLPMKRGGQPHEIAEAVIWLLSDSASYATGTFIDMAGGL